MQSQVYKIAKVVFSVKFEVESLGGSNLWIYTRKEIQISSKRFKSFVDIEFRREMI